jgi:ADP-heptose:LPS heptosyltransferase
VVAHIVVFRPGALGDTLLTGEALMALRRRFPQAVIELVGNEPAALLLRDAGLVDRVASFDAVEVTSLFMSPSLVSPRWQGADGVVLWLASSETIASAFRAAGVDRVIQAPPEPASHGIHVADYLAATLAPLGVEPDPTGAPALLHGLCTESRSAPRREPKVLVHPGSGAARKNWPAAAYAQAIRRLAQTGWDLAVLAGPADEGAVTALLEDLGDPQITVHRSPDLRALVRVLCAADLVIGNDSGVSHLSARLGVATLAIFGATDPARWSPRGPAVRILGTGTSWPTVGAVVAAAADLLGASGAVLEQKSSGEEAE